MSVLQYATEFVASVGKLLLLLAWSRLHQLFLSSDLAYKCLLSGYFKHH